MKKLSPKQKAWQIAHAKQMLRRLSKRKKRNNKKSYANELNGLANHPHVLSAPPVLSLIENQEATLAFFKLALNTIKKCHYNEYIYFNLSRVECISTDAIMYIIALMNNVRRVKRLKIMCGGNVPMNEEAQALIENSGFYSYVSSDIDIKQIQENERIQISEGREADGALAGKICDFVINVSNKERETTKSLFSLIMELMTNTKQHAYRSGNSIMDENWYVFAENLHDKIRFVFLDTGAGIPSTIRKDFSEKVAELLIKNDAKFIASALKGEFRSETKQEYRGKGLPEVYNASRVGQITDLVIISGKGKCAVNNDGEIMESGLKTSFVGTLVCWSFMK